ncbi:MAG: hypothetical protein NTU97_03175, partial [Candidatus Magasanikbacteria bacterium]|nr:hypothetical protein [Candidatus Magasanikbacteria bacterium]
LKQIKNINDPNDSVFRHVLSSVLGESYGRRGLVESPISKEGKKRIIRTIFESIAMVLKRTEKGYLSGQLEKISETSLAGAIFYNNWSLLLEAISESIKELNLENSDYGIKSLLRGMADVWTKELMKDISTSNPHDLYHFTSRAIRLLSEYQSRLQALKEMSEEAEK